MNDDRVIEPNFDLSVVYTETDWGMKEIVNQTNDRGAYTWEAPLGDYADFNKLRFPEITVNYEATKELFEVVNDVLGDILEVKEKNYWWWSFGLTYQFIFLRGLENLMYDMYDHPAEVHKLMKFLMDGMLHKIDFLEKNNLLSINSTSDFIGSHSHGYTNDLDINVKHVKPINMWGFAESQETVSVAPDMFEEFVFQYQLPILKKFGLNYYGCCEPLNTRWDIIKTIPRLRKVSISAWANLNIMREQLQNNYVYSIKPNPSLVATANPDWNLIKSELKNMIDITKGCSVEFILKDLNTIGNNPENVKNWCKLAKELILN